ncbi:MAG: protein-export membrane protein SecD [Candidatus Aminicenantes bacterium RBG_19FT_COMBO_65_30]|nr:MAG: protein-export membrane protein SecD [Candidatus Aminicenantes bacterium RBG_19FT_COMBO_65_30]
MKKNLQWKVILALAVIAGAIIFAYPFNDTKIRRGLDLKGGIHLVLQVITDDSINMETDQEIARLEELLKKNSITFQKVTKEGIGRIAVQGVLADEEGKTRDLFEEYTRDWDYGFTGDRANLTLKPLVVQLLRDQSVSQAKETIDNRINQFGVAEPLIQRQGSDKIIVELPGVDNPDRVKELIKVTAVLEWKLVKAGPAADEATLLQATNGQIPDDAEVLKGDPKRAQGGFYLVDKVAVVTGKDLRTIRRTQDEWNNPAVSFTLNADGGARFEQVTGANIGKQIAIILDKKIQSAPVVEDRILRTQGGVIRGRFTPEEADDLVVVLKAGALPAGIKYLEERTIGPALGADSIRQGLVAGLVAIVAVMTFMVVFYKLSGFNAVAALLLNVLILFGALAYFKAALTLPGIAGIILAIGMAVDANVLIFERIKEELALGKGVLSSISQGFSRAFTAIFDSNITTIIAAIFLFQFGTGPIRGYAVTLTISLCANLFTAVFISHLLFDLTVKKTAKRMSI